MSTVTRERLAEIKARYTAASDATCPDVPDLVETLEWYIAVAGALGESQERLAKELREARDVSEGRREEAFAWTSAYFEEQRKRNEACAEVERLKAALRLLWSQSVDICGPAGATIQRAFTDECRAAVVAALGEDALKEDNQ